MANEPKNCEQALVDAIVTIVDEHMSYHLSAYIQPVYGGGDYAVVDGQADVLSDVRKDVAELVKDYA